MKKIKYLRLVELGWLVIQCHLQCHRLIKHVYEFLYTFHINYVPLLNRFRDTESLFCRKSQMFATPVEGDSTGLLTASLASEN